MYATTTPWLHAPARTPEGATILAVGDIHGCSAQLDAMTTLLGWAVADAREAGRVPEIVLLGDYVDRGPDSVGVLRRLPLLAERTGALVHCLLGNHDFAMREALRRRPERDDVEGWLWMGGLSVLNELGGEFPRVSIRDPERFAAMAREALGAETLRVLDTLLPSLRAGGYVFVHGGVHPVLPLDAHAVHDLIWMREPFLEPAEWTHDFVVVHGHTPGDPSLRAHRIGLDSGCFATGVLTAAELADDLFRLHLVAARADPKIRLDGIETPLPRFVDLDA